MGRVSASTRRCQSKLAKHRYSIKLKKIWQSRLEEFDSFDISNPKGRSRTLDENKMVIQSIKMLMSVYMDMVDQNLMSIYDISWTFIDEKDAKYMGVRRQHVTELRNLIFEDGDVLLFGENKGELSVRGAGSPSYDSKRFLSKQDVLALVAEVDRHHHKGKTITNQLMRNFVRAEFGIEICKKPWDVTSDCLV